MCLLSKDRGTKEKVEQENIWCRRSQYGKETASGVVAQLRVELYVSIDWSALNSCDNAISETGKR
jgi:hypothetical protein